jgi:hypothetical protein
MHSVLVRVPRFALGEEPAPEYRDPSEYRRGRFVLPVGFEIVVDAATPEERGELMVDPRLESVDFDGDASSYPRPLPASKVITMERIAARRWDAGDGAPFNDGEVWGV